MFDVYVKGINPQRISELEDIKKKVSVALSGEQDLNRLLYPPQGSVCIRKNIPEQQAKQTHDILVKLGLLCTYHPSRELNWQKLALVPKDDPENLFTCPACHKQKRLDGNPEPKLCPFCNVLISKYREEQKEKEEYEQIRQKILRQSRIHLEQEKRLNLTEDEKKRKALLEKQVAKELGLEPKFDWRALLINVQETQKRYWLIPVLLVAAGWAIYQPSSEQDTGDPFAHDIPELAQPTVVRPTQAILSIPDKYMLTVDSIAAIPQATSINQPPSGYTRNPLTNNPSHRFYATYAQQSTLSHPATGKNATTTPPPVKNEAFLEDMYNELNADIEWDAFLGKMARSHITTGKLKTAYQLSQHQTDLTTHIRVIADLLATFSKLTRNDLIDTTINKLAQRIATQPPELQAIYKAQLSGALQAIGKPNTLSDEAETTALNLGDAISQSRASSGIAVYKNKSGQTEAANKLFSQAEEKLKSAAPNFDKFYGYITLAQNYTKLGFAVNAEIAMTEAEALLAQVDAANKALGWSMLLNVAYASNKLALADKYAGHIQSNALRSKAIYQNIQTQLKDNPAADVSAQLEKMTDPEYAGVATALSAFLESASANQSTLASTAHLKLTSIQDTESKAVATSKVARYFYRLGNEKEAMILFDQAYEHIQNLADINSKDIALAVLATDYARIFLNSRAERMANMIHSKSLKTATLAAVEDANAIKGILAD